MVCPLPSTIWEIDTLLRQPRDIRYFPHSLLLPGTPRNALSKNSYKFFVFPRVKERFWNGSFAMLGKMFHSSTTFFYPITFIHKEINDAITSDGARSNQWRSISHP